MKKTRRFVYRCTNCGHEEQKWLGRCPECGQWNTLEEAPASDASASPSRAGKTEKRALPRSVPLSSIDADNERRLSTGIPEFDRVLGISTMSDGEETNAGAAGAGVKRMPGGGAGIMKRSAVLVGGEPGIGKSTLLLQTAALVRANKANSRVLYISGEESAGQVKSRAVRLGLDTDGIEIFCSGNLDEINTVLDAVKPLIVIIDSAQTLYSPDAGLVPGTVNQMKYCCFELISWVKEHDSALFIVAHVTKEGIISGPKSIEHMVDTVLYFEQGEGDCRFLRAAKNRFGSVDEIGIFTMGDKGLSVVEDPSTLFLIAREGGLPPGVAVASVLEGSRPLLVEIQALTVPAKGSVSRVFSGQVESSRVARVAATIEKSLGLRLSDQDIYVNVAGGIRINEVGVELALAAAIYSARTGLPLPARTAITGELSLAAEARPVRRQAGREKNAHDLGYVHFISPETVKTLKDAVHALYETA